MKLAWYSVLLLGGAFAGWASAAVDQRLVSEERQGGWVQAMRDTHARFTGQIGTFAQFGDSITVTLAFWAPLPQARRNASEAMEEAFQLVSGHMRPECWREWKGPRFGSEGSTTVRWADEHLDEWLRRLNPEAALIMFGSNDLHALALDEYRDRLRTVVQKCLTNGTVVMLSTPPPRSGFVEKGAAFAEAVREIARDLKVPLLDYHGEILLRRPDDWNGALDKFSQWKGYDVPTLVARDGVHPSHPRQFQNDYSEEALSHCGFSLRNYQVLMKYAEVIEQVLQPPFKPWFPKASPMPEPQGEVIRAASVRDLFSAVERVSPGGTVLLADGHYLMPRYLEIHKDNVTLRSASGKRERVVLDGLQSQHGELVGITRCSGVTIADLTIQNVRFNGFKLNSDTGVQRVTIRNCVIHNIWQRGVKGVKVPAANREAIRPKDCRIQYCLFYNDRPKQFTDDPTDVSATFNGNYVGGIDVMFAKNWIISDNVFIGIQGRTQGARGAVFLWHETEDCVVERNIIIDCDSGIALGNSHRPDDLEIHCRRCVVRNNFVTRAPENGLLADYTRDCQIVHNTVHDPGNRLLRLIRLVHDNDGLLVANNLLSGPPMRIETTKNIRLLGNVTREVADSFVNALEGNLHLRESVAGVVDAAANVPGIPLDIDSQRRSDPADVGAAEFVPSHEPRSSRRQEAQSFPGKSTQSLLTSAPAIREGEARMPSVHSLSKAEDWGEEESGVVFTAAVSESKAGSRRGFASAEIARPKHFPHRIWAACDYERRTPDFGWFGPPETNNIPRYPGNTTALAVGARPYQNFSAIMTGINPVPGPRMGQVNSLYLRYFLTGATEATFQHFSLTSEDNNHIRVSGLTEKKWSEVTLNFTRDGQRNDGTPGVPFKEGERMDDLKIFVGRPGDGKTYDLLIDDVIFFAEDPNLPPEPEPFPNRVIFLAAFDTGPKEKYWPGEFELVEKDLPRDSYWRAARAVPRGDKREKWMRLQVEPPLPVGSHTKLRFRYHLTGASKMTVQMFDLTDQDNRHIHLSGLTEGRWTTIYLDFTRDARRNDGSATPFAAGHKVDDIFFFVQPAGDRNAELLIDEVVLFDAGERD